MGAGEGATITGRIITVSVDAAAAAVVDVDGGAAARRADKQGILPIGQRNMARTDPDRYHPPRRSSHRQWDNTQCPMLQPIPSTLAVAAVRRTIRHTPHKCNNLALHNHIRHCRSRSCRHNIRSSHISIHDSRNSSV